MLAEVVAETPMVGVEGHSKVVLDAMKLVSTLGLSFGGDDKSLMKKNLDIEENRNRVEGVSVSNPKRKRELKNLECSINFDARGSSSSRVKGRVI
jgi:hypothetical protein